MFKRKYKRSEWMEGLLEAEELYKEGYVLYSYEPHWKAPKVAFVNKDFNQSVLDSGSCELVKGMLDFDSNYKFYLYLQGE